MKKILILAAAVGLSALSSYAQGTINFANSLATTVIVSNTLTHTTSSGGTNAGTVVELFYQPGGGSAPTAIVGSGGNVSLGSWEATLGNNPFVTVGSNGRFAGGGNTTGVDVAPSGNAWLTVLGWNGGWTSLASAMSNNAPIVESTIFELTTGGGGTPPAVAVNLTASTAGTGFVGGTAFGQMVTLAGVPEPATMAIAGLGTAALFLYRRRRK